MLNVDGRRGCEHVGYDQAVRARHGWNASDVRRRRLLWQWGREKRRRRSVGDWAWLRKAGGGGC